MNNIFFVVALVFTTLKLTGAITWSWPLVLTPVWVWLGLVIIVALMAAVAKHQFKKLVDEDPFAAMERLFKNN